ncbi:MAG: ribosome biogenesis GTPase YlqF [Clostridia bacterium]|nr:ribosome biogenesis GTPase YlqF [Clostridia bacterium]
MREIQWFPGHMKKTQRRITEELKSIDFTFELLDARIPLSSKNPDLKRLTQGKPSIVLLGKSDLADPSATREFVRAFSEDGTMVFSCDCKSGNGLAPLKDAVQKLCADRLEKNAARGIHRPLRAMIVGVPNVGKSALINRLCKKAKTKVENRPGVTRELSWTRTDLGFDLLDTPGVLWPKFTDRKVGENLAITGAIRDEVLSVEEIAYALLCRFGELYPDALQERYGITDPSDYDTSITAVAKRRGMLLGGGVPDEERAAKALIDDFRSARIGTFTLERL